MTAPSWEASAPNSRVPTSEQGDQYRTSSAGRRVERAEQDERAGEHGDRAPPRTTSARRRRWAGSAGLPDRAQRAARSTAAAAGARCDRGQAERRSTGRAARTKKTAGLEEKLEEEHRQVRRRAGGCASMPGRIERAPCLRSSRSCFPAEEAPDRTKQAGDHKPDGRRRARAQEGWPDLGSDPAPVA